MTHAALNAKSVQSYRPAPKRYDVFDALLPGFGIRVAPSGRKTWFLFARVSGRQIRHRIGTYPVLHLSEARLKAQAIARDIQLGVYVDRRAQKIVEVAPITLRDAIPDFIEKYAKPKNRSWKETQRDLWRFVPIVDLPLASIKRADVVRTLDTIIAAGVSTRANRALAALKKLFAWSLDRGLIDHHPIAGLKPPRKENTRDRILRDSEIARFWQAVSALPFPFGPLLKVVLLTAQRRNEVTGMRWSEVDWDRRVWTIPASRAKNGHLHEVPLTDPVLDILKACPRFVGSDYVFTTTGVTPVSGLGKVKQRLEDAIGSSDWQIHDLRRTAASGMARLGVAPHVVEKVLNHVSGTISGVAAIYNRHGYDPEKRDALERWTASVTVPQRQPA